MFYFFFFFFSLAVPFVNDFLVVHLLHLTLVTSRTFCVGSFRSCDIKNPLMERSSIWLHFFSNSALFPLANTSSQGLPLSVVNKTKKNATVVSFPAI
jgi:hypothetical protein